MENLNVVNDTQQAVVEPAQASSDTGAVDSGTPEPDVNAESAVRTQSSAKNSGFKKLRLENESYKKQIEELKNQLSGLSELETLKAQNGVYLDTLVKNSMDLDLKAIQKLDPKVKSLSQLGDDFIRLLECGIDAKTAYSAVMKARESDLTPKPTELGAIGHSERPDSHYYTSNQLDRLTAKDLENPAVYKKAMESLKRL